MYRGRYAHARGGEEARENQAVRAHTATVHALLLRVSRNRNDMSHV